MAGARERECLLSVWKGVTPANLFKLWGWWESDDFLVDFGVNFLPVGTPGASRAPLGDQVVSQNDFVTVFRCPGDALWGPGGPFGRPWACLGATLGITWAPKVAKKE